MPDNHCSAIDYHNIGDDHLLRCAARWLWLLLLTTAGSRAHAASDVQLLSSGKQIYAEHCASCHGEDLRGQLNWKVRLPSGRMPAPPHDASGHTWHHSDRDLFLITKKGVSAIVPGYESDMPGFGTVLSDTEIHAVLEFIKSAWPEKEREYQAEQTRLNP